MIYLSPTLIVGMIKQSVGGKTMLNSQLRILGGIVSVFLIFACADLPEDCGRNVRKVVALDFEGPTVIETTPEFDFTAYDVTITVEKENREDSAQVCYAVRDEDPWYKFFWAVDDVLDANFMVISAGQNSRTFEGHFGKEAEPNRPLTDLECRASMNRQVRVIPEFYSFHETVQSRSQTRVTQVFRDS